MVTMDADDGVGNAFAKSSACEFLGFRGTNRKTRGNYLLTSSFRVICLYNTFFSDRAPIGFWFSDLPQRGFPITMGPQRSQIDSNFSVQIAYTTPDLLKKKRARVKTHKISNQFNDLVEIYPWGSCVFILQEVMREQKT